MSARRHENRVIALLQTLLGKDVVRSEKAVPRVAHAIDALIRIKKPTELWGPLSHLVAHRTVVIEHESRPPPRLKLYTALAKLNWIVRDEWRQIQQKSGRFPLLLFLSAGCPRWVSSGERGFVPTETPGVYQMRWSLPTDTVFVNLRGLPDGPGTSLLKLMPTPRNEAEIRAGIERLRKDPAVVQFTKKKVLEAIMNQQIPATDQEHWITVESVQKEGRKQGRKQGRNEGRNEGRRETALNLARRLLDPDEIQDLEAIDDPDELERRLLALLEAR